jgi:hypothetical protein
MFCHPKIVDRILKKVVDPLSVTTSQKELHDAVDLKKWALLSDGCQVSDKSCIN